MEELLSKLYIRLAESFKENLKLKEIKYLSDGNTVNVLKTFLSLNKTGKDLKVLMYEGAIPIEELKYINKDGYEYCLKTKLLIKCTGASDNKAFIGLNGIFEYCSLSNLDFREAFIAYDFKTFPDLKYVLKPHEKVLCIFLILLGADSEKTMYNTETLTPKQLDSNHKFFKTIETVMNDNGVQLGKSITWGTGKDVSFRKFLTNNVQLPQTGLYKYKGKKYYLDLSKRKNVVFLLDLILDKYNEEQRLDVNDSFYDALRELSYKMLIEIGELRVEFNKNIIEILKS